MDWRQARVMFPTFVMGFLPPRALRLISYFAEEVLQVWFIATPWDLTRDWGRLFAWMWLHPICMRMCSAWRQDSSCYLTKVQLCRSICLFGFHWDMMLLFCYFSRHIPHLPALCCNCVQFWTSWSFVGHWGEGIEFFMVFSQVVWLFCPRRSLISCRSFSTVCLFCFLLMLLFLLEV